MLTVTACVNPNCGVILCVHDEEVGLTRVVQVSPTRALEIAALVETIGGVTLTFDSDTHVVHLGDDTPGLRVIAKLDGHLYDKTITDPVELSNLAYLIDVQSVMERDWSYLSPFPALYCEYHACKPHKNGSFALAEVCAWPTSGVVTRVTMHHPVDCACDDIDYRDVMELATQLPPIVTRAEEAFARTINARAIEAQKKA